MKKMMKHIFPYDFFTNPAYFRAFVLSLLYLGVVVAQLFTFEKFADVTLGYGLPGGTTTAAIVAGDIVLLEAMALPYLISMRIGERWRQVSRWAVLSVPVMWLLLGLWLNFSPYVDKVNSGLFGATIITPVHYWLIVFALLWLWAAVLVTRELPARQHQRKYSSHR